MQLSYSAPPTLARFLQSNDEVRVVMGPVGSGKSSACAIENLKRACAQEPDKDKVRRSRGVVVRNTMPMLRDTTIPTFLDWFPHNTLGAWHSTNKIYYFRFPMPDGTRVECDILFRALDDADDVSKLLSLEVTWCWFNEFREIKRDIFEGMKKRIGRYPSKKNDNPGATWCGIFCDTNPPQVGSWHQMMMEKEIESDWDVFKQPSGRADNAENLNNLRPGYYNTTGLSEEYVRVMIDGQYGHDMSGMPVFGKVFLPSYHVAKEPPRVLIGGEFPLLIGMDTGLKPAASIGQMDYRGKLRILGECYTEPSESMGMERFITTRLSPYLRMKFPQAQSIFVIIDPSIKRSEADEQTAFSIVQKYFKGIPAPTNAIEARINAVESWFARQINGEAGIEIDPTLLFTIKLLEYGYRFEKKKDTGLGQDTKDEPAKNHYSHLADALQYLCLYTIGGFGAHANFAKARQIQVVSARGWT